MNKTFTKAIEGQRILFVTTKNIDYIRNAQEIRILEKYGMTVKKIYSNKKGYLCRIIEIWFKLIMCRKSDYDCVFIGFAPQLIFPFFGKFRNTKIIIDFFISVYDTLVNDRKIIKPKTIMSMICHKLDAYVIDRADSIIVDTKADKNYFVNEFLAEDDKFQVLYLEADKSVYYPKKKTENGDKRFVVLYFGSILPLQGIDVILRAVRLLRDYDDILIQIIGPIPKKYNKPIQDNIEYIDWLSQEKLAEYIADADLCLAGHFNADIEKAKRTIPGKAYIYDAMRKPMILGDNEANREVFMESGKYYYVPMGNPEKLKECIVAYKDIHG